MVRINRLGKEATQLVTVRLPESLVEQIDQAIALSLASDQGDYQDRTDFLCQAIRAVFRHRERAKASRKRRQERRREAKLTWDYLTDAAKKDGLLE